MARQKKPVHKVQMTEAKKVEKQKHRIGNRDIQQEK